MVEGFAGTGRTGATLVLAFAWGSMVPLLAVLLTPDVWRAAVTFVTVLARTTLTATAAMSLSLLVGSLFHPERGRNPQQRSRLCGGSVAVFLLWGAAPPTEWGGSWTAPVSC